MCFGMKGLYKKSKIVCLNPSVGYLVVDVSRGMNHYKISKQIYGLEFIVSHILYFKFSFFSNSWFSKLNSKKWYFLSVISIHPPARETNDPNRGYMISVIGKINHSWEKKKKWRKTVRILIFWIFCEFLF
jgi:hypothetical protein